MIEVNEVRNDYNDLYRCLMMYTWNLSMIRALADLEVSCHTSCNDVDDIRRCLDRVHYEAVSVCKDDDDLNASFDKFYSDIESQDSTYLKLDRVKEVNQL